MKKTSLDNVSQLIAKSWFLFKSNINPFIQPIVILILTSALFLFFSLNPWVDSLAYTILYTLTLIAFIYLSILIKITFLQISDKLNKKEDFTLPEIYHSSYKKIFKYLGVTLTFGFPLILSLFLTTSLLRDVSQANAFFTAWMILFVIALIISPWYYLSTISVALDKDAKTKSAILKSFALTKKRYLSVLWRILAPQAFFSLIVFIIVLGVAGIVTSGQLDLLTISDNYYFNLLSVIISTLFAPLMNLPLVILYNQLNISN